MMSFMLASIALTQDRSFTQVRDNDEACPFGRRHHTAHHLDAVTS
jgi:hypothetical protein